MTFNLIKFYIFHLLGIKIITYNQWEDLFYQISDRGYVCMIFAWYLWGICAIFAQVMEEGQVRHKFPLLWCQDYQQQETGEITNGDDNDQHVMDGDVDGDHF